MRRRRLVRPFEASVVVDTAQDDGNHKTCIDATQTCADGYGIAHSRRQGRGRSVVRHFFSWVEEFSTGGIYRTSQREKRRFVYINASFFHRRRRWRFLTRISTSPYCVLSGKAQKSSCTLNMGRDTYPLRWRNSRVKSKTPGLVCPSIQK